MSIGPDILLDADGDLDMSNGDLKMQVSIAQSIQIRLRYFKSEWFLDTTKGLAYFDLVYVKNPNLSHLKSLFRRCILDTPGVTSLDSFSFDHVALTRRLTINFSAQTSQGEISFDGVI